VKLLICNFLHLPVAFSVLGTNHPVLPTKPLPVTGGKYGYSCYPEN
jgi:hypothetical protein